MSCRPVLPGLLVTLLCCGAARLPAADYAFNFSGGKVDNQWLKLLGPEAAQVVRPSPEGLRMEFARTPATAEVGLGPRFRLNGDFQITAWYEIIDLPRPDEGYGAGPTIYIATETAAEDAATLGRLHRIQEGHVYNAHSAAFVEPEAGGERQRRHNVRLTETTAQAGALRLVRTKDRLQYLVAEGESTDARQLDFVQLDERPFTDAEVAQVRVGLNRNGANTPAAIVWKRLEISAEEFTGLPTLEEVAQAERRSRWWTWILIGAVVLGAVAGVWYWRRRRPPPEKVDPGP